MPNTNLSVELKKNLNLWDIEFRNEQKINEILEPFEEFNLKVGQSLNLYQIIVQEEKFDNCKDKTEKDMKKINGNEFKYRKVKRRIKN